MFISNDWLVSYPGFKNVLDFREGELGRGLFHSIRGGFLVYVVGSSVYKITSGLGKVKIGTMKSRVGEVYIAENLSSQICIVDGVDAYIYNWKLRSLTAQNFSQPPGYVSYHNSFFLITSDENALNPQNWYVYELTTGDATSITKLADNVGGTFSIQTKPDICLAVHRIPGRGNNIIAIGSSVSEIYSMVGGTENYRRNSGFNINSGCVSKSTIAYSDNVVCWLGKNESNAPIIMFTDGSQVEQLSTDGINYLLQEITTPLESTAFFFKQDGHLFYQLTFYNENDNISLIYDFMTKMFFHVSDYKSNFHPARQVVYFEEKSYFASISDGSVYEMSSDIIDQVNIVGDSEGEILPRVRICNTIRQPSTAPFRVNYFTFAMEQGVNTYPLTDVDETSCTDVLIGEDGFLLISEGSVQLQGEDGVCGLNPNRPCVDMAISKNGAISFSNSVRRYLNAEGQYRNIINWHRLGFANQFTIELRFVGLQRFVVNNGLVEIA